MLAQKKKNYYTACLEGSLIKCQYFYAVAFNILNSEHVVHFVQEYYSHFLCLCSNISVTVAKYILYLYWKIFNVELKSKSIEFSNLCFFSF